MAANDGCVGAYGCSAANKSLPVLILAAYGAARIYHVGENAGRSEEHIIAALHPGINAHIVLNLHIVPKNNAWTHHHVLTYVAVLPYPAIRHDMAEMPDFCSFANSAAFIYV